MTQPVANPTHTVDRDGFANPLTLSGILVTDASYLKVYADDTEISTAAYTVDGLNDPAGIEVTITDGEDLDFYVDVATFTVVFEPPIEQAADLSVGGQFGRAYESALDAVLRIVMSLAGKINRTLKVPYGVEGDIVLPTPVAGATFMWNDDGTAIITGPTAENIGNADAIVAAAAASAVLADEAADRAELAAGGVADFNRPVERFTITTVGPYDMGVAIGTANNLDVKVGGVIQDHNLYTVAGTTFTFLTLPSEWVGLDMEAALIGSVRSLLTPADASVGLAALDAELSARIDEIGVSSDWEFNVTLYGAAPGNTDAQNKTALQAAIDACEAAGGGVVIVPPGIDYGYVATSSGTHPDFTGTANDMMVIDYGPGSSYSSPAREGWQERRFYNTPQTSPAGQHDGNGFKLLADWHPYYWVDVSGGYIAYGGGGARPASYNYRASYFTGLEGVPVWQWGQGSLEGDYPDADLLNFQFVGYVAGVATYYPLLIDYSNGAAVYGLGTNAPAAAHHFYHPATVVGLPTMKFQTALSELVMTFQNSGGDATLRLDANLHFVSDEAFLAPYFRPNQYTTGARPSPVTCGAGAMIYDVTLEKPIWSNGSVWKDASGAAV